MWVKNMKAKDFTFDTLKGVSLGVSVAVPGLSAGTIAISEGCYDTIINSVSDLKKEFKKNFLILLPFLLGLLIGAIAAFVGIKKGYEYAPFTLTGLFAGLVIGGLPVAVSELKKGKDNKEKIIHISLFVVFLIISAGIGIISALLDYSLDDNLKLDHWWMYIFILLAGFLATFACIVPGISGSMTLMVIGLYQPILNLYIGDNSMFKNKEQIAPGLVFLLLLVLGAILGIIVSSKTMKVLLSKHRVSTFYSILGLIIGSTVSMFINGEIFPRYSPSNVDHIQTWDYIVGSILFVLGILISLGIFFLDKHLKNKKVEENNTIKNEDINN